LHRRSCSRKTALILGSVDFFSILSDGSQAQKTKAEKELVFIRMERNGIPVYIVASLLEMEKFSGGNANTIVKGSTVCLTSLVLIECPQKIMKESWQALQLTAQA
jgi:hypothetical protein